MEILDSPFNVLFLDIETAPIYESLEEAPERYQGLWKKKEGLLNKISTNKPVDFSSSGIYAEFGKIICISCAQIKHEDSEFLLNMISFYQNDEKKLLSSFFSFVDGLGKNIVLCAHNGKEFDFPYICRRGLINHLDLPKAFQLRGKKPWEINHVDTLEMWKFGDYKNYTSLDVLAHVFELDSPKHKLSGEDVYHYYYKKRDLKSIRSYCEDDVLTLVRVYLHLTHNTKYLPNLVEVERNY